MDDSDKIKLRVMGLSIGRLQSGAYVLVLAQVGGNHRIPVVIGAPEAQSIALKMEGIVPPRPLTHDIFAAFTHAFGIGLKQVLIYKFEDGVFYSELTFEQEGRVVKIDARTSDAVAIAVRTDAPIYVTRDVMEETAFDLSDTPFGEDGDGADNDDTPETNRMPRLENYTIEELERTLQQLVSDEDYEQASRVKKLITLKKESQATGGDTQDGDDWDKNGDSGDSQNNRQDNNDNNTIS